MGEPFARVRAWLASPRVPRIAVASAALFGSATLGNGIVADDLWHRAAFEHPAGFEVLHRSWWKLFAFFQSPTEMRVLRDLGLTPWWGDENAYAYFFRPLSSATHALDWTLFPSSPALMHAHSAAWYVALVAIVAWLYERFLGAGTVAAGLATLLYAVDPNHGIPVGWLANRNALVAAVFAFAALGLHDVASKSPSPRWGLSIGAAVLVGLGLSGGESALAIAAYLAAHAIFLDARPVRARLASLAPFAIVLSAWSALYKIGGYGVHLSGMYLDPLRNPVDFLINVFVRFPLVVSCELGFPSPDAFVFVPVPLKVAMFVGAVGFVAWATPAALRLVRTDARARFLLAGSLVGTLPACATFPAGRLVTISGFGLLGFTALVFAATLERASWVPDRGAARVAIRSFGWLSGGLRLVLSPAVFLASLLSMGQFNVIIARLAKGLPAQTHGEPRRVVLANSPDSVFFAYALATRKMEDKLDYRLVTLAGGARRVTLRRADSRTVIAEVEGGLYRTGTENLTRRPESPMPAGTRVDLTGMHIEILKTAEDGVPTEIAYHFDEELESPSLAWRKWEGNTIVPLTPPREGETLVFEGRLPMVR